jgi:hypothetical protein
MKKIILKKKKIFFTYSLLLIEFKFFLGIIIHVNALDGLNGLAICKCKSCKKKKWFCG